MSTYRRVTKEDRLMIYAFRKEGASLTSIGSELGFNKSTISRELSRNAGARGYRPKQADEKSKLNVVYRGLPRKMTSEMILQIKNGLSQKWSPEQISNRLKLEEKRSVSHETIYKYIYRDKVLGGRLFEELRQGHKKRKRRFPSQKRKGRIKDAVPISFRSRSANNRTVIGHMERDLVIGKSNSKAVITIVDRKSRFTKLGILDGKNAVAAGKKTVEILHGIPLASMTNDRGLEFADHKTTRVELGCPIYFCDPYSSQQRGTNENTNGLLRQYLPKKMEFSWVTQKDLNKIETELNFRPRKCLDWLSPFEAEWGVRVALTS